METPNDQLHIDRLRDLLRRLKDTLESFASKEAELERTHHLQLHRQREGSEQGTTSEKERLEAAIESAEGIQAERLNALDDRYRRRSERIEKAFLAAKNRLSRSLQEQEGHRVYQLQMTMIQEKKGLASAREKRHQEQQVLLASLARERETLVKLRKVAANAFRGYPAFGKALAHAPTPLETEDSEDRNGTEFLADATKSRSRASEALAAFRKLGLPRFFAAFPVLLLVVLVGLAAAGVALGLPAASGVDPSVSFLIGGAIIGIGFIGIFILSAIGRSQGQELASQVVSGIHQSRDHLDRGEKWVIADYDRELHSLEDQAEESTREFENSRQQSPEEAAAHQAALEENLRAKYERARQNFEKVTTHRRNALEAAHHDHVTQLRTHADSAVAELDTNRAASEEKLNHAYEVNWSQLEQEWHEAIAPIYQEIESVRRFADAQFPSWTREWLETWKAPAEFAHAARLGAFSIDLDALASAMPQSGRLPLPGPRNFDLPVSLVMPQRGSVLFESDGGGREAMLGSLNQLILRFLSVAPPAKLSFTIIDPIGLGEGFSGLMHLGDYEESLINSRIWTQTQQIEARLGDLNDHIEKVIQMYLRNEFASITDYNRQAGRIAEKYHFVVIADFPANFSEVAAKRLLSIAASGARCGVYLMMHWDRSKPVPQEFDPEIVRQHALGLTERKGGQLLVEDREIGGVSFTLDQLADESLTNDFIHRIGEASRDAERVEVPFSDVAPPDGAIWSEVTTQELRVPIGRTGATKQQFLAIGRDTRQHALIAGKTGSGKSTLFHVMVTNLALWCSPDEVEFYLVDFKKGVEFKCYANARLPHARVIAIESDREFGLSVLQRLDEELKRRGDLFRDLGVQDLPGYEKAGGTQAIPRSLLLIDEFQEFFVEDDRIAQNANVLLDRIVRQGRAFGIHVILGSQTLGGAYTLARATLGQMAIRIALQCNEADAYLIMDDTNPAPRLLTRPGEGIYNDQSGMVEGNSPFQVVWLPDDERDEWLAKVTSRAAASDREFSSPIIFEGNAPADIRENGFLSEALASFPAETPPTETSLWLGAPNAIKGPTRAVFQRQSGNHLLIVGQRDEAAIAMLTSGMLGIAAQHPRGGVRFILLDSSPPETPERSLLDRLPGALPQDLSIARGNELEETMNEIATELERRTRDEAASATAPAIFLFINGLQRLKKLRYEEDFSFSLDEDAGGADPGTQFNTLITDGPALGIHVVAICDTYNNLNRTLSRKALSECEMRVLFQMSANDSASLIDSPKASSLGLHRALFYNEQEGYLETFRPYAPPEGGWFESAFPST